MQHRTTPKLRGNRHRRWLGPFLALALLAPLAGLELFAEPALADDTDEADDVDDVDDADDAEGSEDVAPADDGVIVPFNTSNPVQLNSKTVDTPSSPSDPLRPGDEIVYTLNYSCSSLATGGNCNDAVLVDPLPQLLDTDGDPVQLEFVDVNTMTPSHWAFQGESGSAPDRQITWEANDLDAGNSGALTITMRVPDGVIPALPEAQEFTNTATASYPSQDDASVESATSYVNALPAASTVSKSGPSSALLNLAGTDPVTYTISICPEPGTVLWDSYEVTDTLPVGATVVEPLPHGGTFTAPDDPDVDGGTVEWDLDPTGDWPGPNAQGCLQWTFQVEFENEVSGGHETNVVGETKTNEVEAIGTNGDASQDIGPASTTLTLTGPVTRFGPSKSARNADDSRPTYYVLDGETVTYRIGASNTSDAEAEPFSTATLTDELPDGFALTEIHTGTWDGAVADVAADIEVSTETSPGPGDWTVVSSGPNETVTGGLTGARWVRWVFTSDDEPAIGSGWSTSGIRLVGDVSGDADPDPIVVTNCSNLSGVQGGISQNRGSTCADVLLEGPQAHPSIDKDRSSATLEPGGTVTYTLSAGNDVDATGVLESGFTVTDCVPDADHLAVSNVVTGSAWTIEPFGTCTPVGGPPNNGDTGTELVFTYTGPDLAPGGSAPSVSYDVTANSFTVPTAGSDPTPPGARRNRAVITDDQGDPFTHCVQSSCQVTRDVTVPFRAELESLKLVRGTLDSHFNIAGTTTPGGQVTWRLEVENRGNIDVENVQYVDVFPHVGDTGVRLIDTPRGSEYAPVLVGPIDAPGWTVEYSTSSNPCRDEVLAPGDTPHTGCEAPDWTASPDLLDLPSYRSIRLTLDGRLERGGTATFEWDMVTPIDDPAYEDGGQPTGRLQDCTIPVSEPPYPAEGNPGASELDRDESATPTCPVANNSFAYGVDVPTDQLGGLPNPGRLGAEAPQVALHVAAETTRNAIGDLVWYDDDNDGIQDPGETGVPGVRVELLDASDPGSPTVIATTFTDADGRYLFDDLPDGDYLVRFYLPDDTAYVSPRWQDDPSITGDHSSEGNSNRDSDVPQDPSGSTGLGNHYDTPVVTLGNPEDVDGDGREIDLTWDAGIWVPDPSVSIDKVTKDTAWPDADADDGVEIVEGRPVTWIYAVTNTGNTYLTGVEVTDEVMTPVAGVDAPGDIVCDWASSTDPATPAQILAPGELVECRATGTAIADDYVNEATVTGTPARFPEEDDGETVYEDIDKVGVPTEVTDDDPSSYHGLTVDITLDKVTAGRYYDLTTGQLTDVGPADGITVTAGLGVVWIYEIENTGTTPLGQITLTDDSGTPGDPSDDVTVTIDGGTVTVDGIAPDQVTVDGDVRGDGILRPGESWTVEIAGTAVLSDYENDAVVRGIAVDQDSGDPLTPPGDPNGEASDDDPSDYTGVPGPAISLEKATNGHDADQPTGPYVLDGEVVTWTFEVTNTGSVPLVNVEVTDPDLGGTVCVLPVLAPGAVAVCEVTGERFGSGQQRNDAEVAGTPAETSQPPTDPHEPDDWSDDPGDYTPFPDAVPITDDDPSHHYGADPAIAIEKATNGEDADTVDLAVPVGPGQPVTWTFEVTNTGNTVLADVTVTDVVLDTDGLPAGDPVTIDCPTSTLQPDEAMVCTYDGVAGDEPHANLATATGQPVDPNSDPVGDEVDDDDPSHYRIGIADLSLAKSASDDAVPGEPMRWELVVRNDGPDDAPAGTVVTDLLPDELRYLEANEGWSCATENGGRDVHCVADHAIPSGTESVLVLTTEVASSANGTITNTATISGVFDDPESPNGDSSGEATVVYADGQARPVTGSGPLPRTGASVIVLVLLGLGAVVTGATLRRRRD